MKPLLILDCDEVILEFAAPFQIWLADAHGIELRYDSYALYGNMREADGSLVEEERIRPLVEAFLTEEAARQTPTAGAIPAIGALEAACEIVVLTNIPPFGEAVRRQRLAELGLDVPVIANSGPKGEAVRRLAAGRRAAFVDDAPAHHESVARAAPAVARLQMVASPILTAIIPDADDAFARIDRWDAALPWLERWIKDDADGPSARSGERNGY